MPVRARLWVQSLFVRGFFYISIFRTFASTMKKLLLLLLCVPLIGLGQTWEKIYETHNIPFDVGVSIDQTSDGGYILSTTGQENSGNYPFIIKVNSQGDSIWSMIVPNCIDGDGLFGAKQTNDGGYIICGANISINGGFIKYSWLMKTDISGNIVWDKTFGDTVSRQSASCVEQTTDGGYVFVGNLTTYIPPGYSEIILTKTNSLGDMLWTRTYVGGVSTSVKQTNDGGYIISGSIGTADTADVYLIKTNDIGNSLWTKTYGGANSDIGCEVQQTVDGGYIIGGAINSGIDSDVYLIKTDGNGIEQWSQILGGSNIDMGLSVKQTSDGGYIIAGSRSSVIGNSVDVLLIKTDANGSQQWIQTYGGTGSEMGYSVQQTFDGGYIIGGLTENGIKNDVYLIKTDGNGNVTSEFTIPINPNREIDKVVDILGRDVKPEKNKPFIEIYNDGTVEKKIIIE